MRSYKKIYISTVVGDYINTMKTTFDLNFDLYQAFTVYTSQIRKNGNKEILSNKKASLQLLVNFQFKKRLLTIKTLTKKVVFILLVLSPTTVL